MSESEADLRAADGRVPGRRGRATRTRLLECTSEMLATTSFRELKVIDIAREANTSPATFYQYFPDVESAILVLAEEMADDTTELTGIVRDGTGTGPHARDAALALVDGFFGFWERYRSLLRVVELAGSEGDRRFGALRSRMLNPVTVALRDVMVEGRPDANDPMAMAGVLVAMLANVAAHRYGFEFWGIPTVASRSSMADLICWGVAGQPSPDRI